MPFSARKYIEEFYEGEEVLIADDLDDAFIGVGYIFNRPLAVYSIPKAVRLLMKRDGMTREDAIEFLEFNTLGAYVGESTPVFLEPVGKDGTPRYR